MIMRYKSCILYIALLAFLVVSCKKGYLDINNDPNNPTKASEALLLTGAEKTMADWLGLDNNNGGVGSILSVYTHQATQYSAYNKYDAVGADVSNMWTGIYVGVLENLSALMAEAKPAGNMQYVGIAKVLEAYTYSQLVDIFGDVPFSEAIDFKSKGITAPKFDKGSDIYPQLFAMLDTAIMDLQDQSAANVRTPGSDDLIYGGDVDEWVAAANTIKLKLYNQERLVTDVKAQVTALESQPLISKTSESFVVPYGTSVSPDERNPGFLEYTATQRTVDISPWFYEILKGYNKNIFTGIVDPRIPYYWFNQLKPDEPDVEGNVPEYRDSGFVSLIFGSDGPQYGSAQDNSQTVMGIYPVGGRYDDGQGAGGQGVGASSGTGAAPFRMITYADRLYIEAELIKAGVLPGGDAAARAKLEDAIRESFKQVDYFVAETGSVGQTVPKLVGSGKDDTYVQEIMSYYDAHPSQQMQVILTEKWISAFGGDYADLYSDYRRTGYPVMFNPNNPAMAPGGKVQPPIHGNPFVDPQAAVPVSISKDYPVTLPWSVDELDANKNAPPQKDPSTYKVFWMP
jgi:hypothetical protein